MGIRAGTVESVDLIMCKKAKEIRRALVVGCGLCGSVIARGLAEQGIDVEIWERREHIGGNMYDYVDEHGFMVQKYGPHTFHAKEKRLYDYMLRFEEWREFTLYSGAVWDGKYTPTPFNFKTIDIFYPVEQAQLLKAKLTEAFGSRESAPVLEVLQHIDPDIHEYAKFLFQNDYAPYTAKQWGIPADQIDPSVLARVPLRFSYNEDSFGTDILYRIMPVHSFTRFFENLLRHPNIHVKLGVDALVHLSCKEGHLLLDERKIASDWIVIYTGALDELFGYIYGELPYRSLRFEWRYSKADSVQQSAVVAYPQEPGYTRVTEYKKLYQQKMPGSSYALEYPIPYSREQGNEPYYPVLTEDSQRLYADYRSIADKIPELVCCGRLADFKYYDMDVALRQALDVCDRIVRSFIMPKGKDAVANMNF